MSPEERRMSMIRSNVNAVRAFVLQVREKEMRVCDCSTFREMMIHTEDAAGFCAGDRVRIECRASCSVGSTSRIRENQISSITRF